MVSATVLMYSGGISWEFYSQHLVMPSWCILGNSGHMECVFSGFAK